MQTQQLQKNMKEKVKVFEDGGIRLLKKGQKGLVHAIFSRFGLVLVLLLLQFGALFSLLRWFGQLLPHYLGGTALVTAAMVIYLLNIDMDNSVRITWLVVIAVLPVLGVPLFWYTKADIGHNALKKRLMDLESQTRAQLPQPEGVEQRLEADSPGAASLARYLRGRGGGFPVYGNTAVTYFNGGEAKFAELLRQLETAEHYIFLEYFIIDEGLMWGRILEVLARKAAGGVDVRVMYDGTCEFSTLPRDYPKRLEALGIRCKVFAPVTPFVSTHYNYRDHRKILVIDGNIAFNGGTNLADEYINEKVRFGHWKDTAIMLEGAAVWSYTMMFLQLWNMNNPNKKEAYNQYRPTYLPKQTNGGFIQPYGDSPVQDDVKGVMVYLDLISNAKRYVYIETPYLIPDHDLLTALKLAAEKGVDVRIITPHIPDKWYVYQLAWNAYQELLESGVKIFEYTPGFIHAKSFVVDDELAVLGTINLDYRSLYLHFECATLIYHCNVIQTMLADFLKTQRKSQPITLEDCKNRKWYQKCNSYVLGLLAPLL
mgnify:CR=1 FL=1